MNPKIKKVLEYEPSLEDIRKKAILLNLFGSISMLCSYVDELDISEYDKFYASIDLSLRLTNAAKTLRGQTDLRTGSMLIDLVLKRWKDGIPEVVWNCNGFLGYKK